MWLTLGLGAYCASQVEPRGPYFQGLRRQAFELCERGWSTTATEALGGEGNADDIRAVGFALIEWMASTARPALPAFVRGMLGGQAKLDDVIQSVLKGDREQFLTASGQWISHALQVVTMNEDADRTAASSSRPGTGRGTGSSPGSRSSRTPARR